MPPRRKPTSTRQKKADQQLKRAIKRGDVPPPDVKKHPHHRKSKLGPTGRQIGGPDHSAVESARKLQSAFIKLPPKYLEETKVLASTLAVPRPIPDEKAIFHSFDLDTEPSDVLTCPKRPKWRFDMSKLEVERNEEGVFKKWIAHTDAIIERWQNSATQTTNSPIHRSPSYFERNLEVWRQLWRVTEISEIILVLLDSRCPILHYPPSLATFLADRQVILVLTKVDITGPVRVEAWMQYFREHFPNSRVIQVESYIEKVASTDHQGRRQYEPHLPDQFRSRLVEVVKEVHQTMLEPPERVKSNPKWLETWVPSVRRDIDWETVMHARGSKTGTLVGGAAVPLPRSADEQDEHSEGSERHHEPEFLTIGLIGQPNVGKSSLLNALFGARKVRASKTPGKTKHFQTLYWTSDVRLVDCPGLVMPNFVPMEMQVLAGILPISRVSAVPACTFFASELLPLERIYNLIHPITKAGPVEDKRTWREGMKVEENAHSQDSPAWTAMDILTAYADLKGWVTAKAGRPDIHRAGNAILRAVAEGRIGWAFWPSGTPLDQMSGLSGEGQGLWIPQGHPVDEDTDEDSQDEAVEHDGDSASIDEQTDDDDDDDDGVTSSHTMGIGRFGALAIGGGGHDSDAGSGDSSDSAE